MNMAQKYFGNNDRANQDLNEHHELQDYTEAHDMWSDYKEVDEIERAREARWINRGY